MGRIVILYARNILALDHTQQYVLYILEDGIYKSIKTVYIKASGVTAESFDPEILFIKTEDGEFVSIATTYKE